MDNNNNASAAGGVGFTGLLTLVFIVLKLCNVITWSWWLVLAPTWLPIAAIILIGVWVAIVVTITMRDMEEEVRRESRY